VSPVKSICLTAKHIGIGWVEVKRDPVGNVNLSATGPRSESNPSRPDDDVCFNRRRGVEQDINEPQPDAPRAGIVAAGIFSTILLFLFGLLCAFLLAFDCGGDGGEPYNAEASLRGEFCETPGHLGLLLFLVFIPALICVIGMIGASKRRSWRHLLFAVGI